tara:strand:- start:10820 stop:11017 length:198 start_codon:yes stop_codon:yes gene_type:complete
MKVVIDVTFALECGFSYQTDSEQTSTSIPSKFLITHGCGVSLRGINGVAIREGLVTAKCDVLPVQ